MNSEALMSVCAISLGSISLFSLLCLLRSRRPGISTPGAHKLGDGMRSPVDMAGARNAGLAGLTGAALIKRRTGRVTIPRLLRYARWSIPPWVFYAVAGAMSCGMLCLTVPYTNYVVQGMCVLAGPVIMTGVLRFCVERRSKKFDADYPQFLMSVVGLLKTGMTITSALDTAARGLEAESLLRQEVLLLLERIKVGILEEDSFGVFGEDIFHPEIELFVQALLLSYRIGGNLSDTLERLARQVRRRQYFRKSAISAVAQQRGSLVVIICILVMLEVYIAIVCPRLVLDGMQSEVGWHVWQVCIMLVIVGFVWVRRITSMKV